MKYNKEWAVEAAKQGVQVLAFYGHVQTGETVDASCLSQWFPCSFVAEGAVEGLKGEVNATEFMFVPACRNFCSNA